VAETTRSDVGRAHRRGFENLALVLKSHSLFCWPPSASFGSYSAPDTGKGRIKKNEMASRSSSPERCRWLPPAYRRQSRTDQQSGVFKIGTEGTYAPFTYHDLRSVGGLDVDIAKASPSTSAPSRNSSSNGMG
jgi:ABC-type amino acid transport substrate-binding protein